MTAPGVAPGTFSADSSQATTAVAVPAPSTTDTPAVAAAPPADPGNTCDAMGIDRAALKEGVCQSRGHTVKVVDRGSELRLNELDATFHGYATADSLTAETGTPPPEGRS